TLPVTVYQFTPYDYELGGTYSYTNDASLVIPTAVLSSNYIIMSRPTLVTEVDELFSTSDYASPGFVVVVATADNTQVEVKSSAYTAAGDGVSALSPGGIMTYQLNKGDVLQLLSDQSITVSNCPGITTGPDSNYTSYCDPGKNYDLTGTEVTANNPVAVWAGHACDFIPFNSYACDHLEEMMFPLETWGKEFHVGLTQKVEAGSDETNIIRVLSGNDNVSITFTPSVENAVTLNRGQFIEFLAPADQHFSIVADGAIMVGKFMVGQNYWTDSYDAMGDPAFGLVVPAAQYRSEYTFTTPVSMSRNFVNVTAIIQTDSSESITLDAQVIPWSTFEPIGTNGYGVARVEVTNTGTGGAHKISASSPSITFGIEVYGHAAYTSYFYPGGLDLQFINPVGKK
ncbi:IgGFc-binding protein, partial [Myxococcota bacterium]|nr:IgGFc-binding protein [Myxococcota bacterium]